MARTFHLQVVTQEGVKADCEALSLQAPGALGYFGVRPDHADMIAELAIGTLEVKLADGSRRVMACTGGIAEIKDNHVVILGDTIEDAEEIDVERAHQSEQRARERLRLRREPDVDARRAEIALARATNRLRTHRKGL
jgi:F-type H+-transporting ATPase subunit epsilon